MVIFEILSSHHHMLRWHEARIDQHTRDMEALHEAGSSLRSRIDALLQEQAASPSASRLGEPLSLRLYLSRVHQHAALLREEMQKQSMFPEWVHAKTCVNAEHFPGHVGLQ